MRVKNEFLIKIFYRNKILLSESSINDWGKIGPLYVGYASFEVLVTGDVCQHTTHYPNADSVGELCRSGYCTITHERSTTIKIISYFRASAPPAGANLKMITSH